MSTPSQVEAIFFAALDRKTEGERADYLNETCEGNVELRRRVDRLLDAYPLATDFLAQPAVKRHAIDTRDSDDPSETLRFDFDCDDRATEDLSFLAPPDWPDSLGRIGHYEVLEVLGRGGFGIVLRAFDDTLKRVVAIKVLSPMLAATLPARKRFLREARSSAKIRHKNIVQVHAVQELPLPYLVMEYIPGETLQQRLDRTGPMGTDEIVQIGVQIADGLAAAHAQGLIHRDIKPTNILLETGPQVCVKITDFGLARAADDASVSQSGIIVGTPMFMAQREDRPVSVKIDGADLVITGAGAREIRLKSGDYTVEASKNGKLVTRELVTVTNNGRQVVRVSREPHVADTNPDNNPARAEFEKWRQQTSTLPAERQLAAVIARLQERNPGFDGRTTHKIENGVVTEIAVGMSVADISPLRVLAQLKSFKCDQLGGGRILSDLSPLKDLKLTSLALYFAPVTDLSPLKDINTLTTLQLWGVPVTDVSLLNGLKLTELDLANTYVSDLSPLREMTTLTTLSVFQTGVKTLEPLKALKLTSLSIGRTNVTNLSPLAEMKLTTLNLMDTQISDLSLFKDMPMESVNCFQSSVTDLAPLRLMKLRELDCSATKVSDLSPLENMLTLQKLKIHETGVTDLTPLQGTRLEEIRLTPRNITRGLEILRDMTVWPNCRAGIFGLTPRSQDRRRTQELDRPFARVISSLGISSLIASQHDDPSTQTTDDRDRMWCVFVVLSTWGFDGDRLACLAAMDFARLIPSDRANHFPGSDISRPACASNGAIHVSDWLGHFSRKRRVNSVFSGFDIRPA